MATGSNGIRVVESSVDGGFGPAISLEATGARIARNRINNRGLEGGVRVAGNDNRIARNVVSGALDSGIRLLSGSGNVIARNWVVHTIPVFANDDTTGDGISVAAATTATLVKGNVAANNGDDGIDVKSAATSLIDNVANNNHDLGINAVPGVVGVGNRASGNGDPLVQCLNVVCN
jgi:parallel beta-helix repeat protein